MTDLIALLDAIDKAVYTQKVGDTTKVIDICSYLEYMFNHIEGIGIHDFSSFANKIFECENSTIPFQFWVEYKMLLEDLTERSRNCFGIREAVAVTGIAWNRRNSNTWSHIDYDKHINRFVTVVVHPERKLCKSIKTCSVGLYDAEHGELISILKRHPEIIEVYPELFV